MLAASPSCVSGIHASRRSEEAIDCESDEDGRSVAAEAPFCWRREMKPGILSFEEGVGWM